MDNNINLLEFKYYLRIVIYFTFINLSQQTCDTRILKEIYEIIKKIINIHLK